MKPYKVKIRQSAYSRDSDGLSIRITIPFKIVKDVLNYERKIAIWIDTKKRIVISGYPIHFEDVNGIMFYRILYYNGSSFTFYLPLQVFKNFTEQNLLEEKSFFKLIINNKNHLILF